MRRLLATALAAWGLAAAALAGAPHLPPEPPATIKLSGVPEVGSTLRPTAAIPAGSSCVWTQGGSTVSTSCAPYTLTATGAVTLAVTTNAVTTYSALTISGSCLTSGTAGAAYSCTGVSASGGSGGDAFALAGPWPIGPTIAAGTGVVGGVFPVVGSYPNLSVSVVDSVGGSAQITPFTLASTAPVAACGYSASSPDDGCSGAPQDAMFSAPNFFTGQTNGYVASSNMLANAAAYNPAQPLNTTNVPGAGIARENGQSYCPGNMYCNALHPAAWSAAGVDFPVGPSMGTIASQSCPGPSAGNFGPSYCLAGGWRDPANIAHDPSAHGCVFYDYNTNEGSKTGDPVHGPQVLCSGTSQIVDIEGYDFSSHGCVSLAMPFTVTANVKLWNNKFIMGPGCATSMYGQWDPAHTVQNAYSPGGAYVVGYAGDRFKGYVNIDTSTLCVTDTNSGDGAQGSVETGNTAWHIQDETGKLSFGNNYSITGAGGSCTAGTAYALSSEVFIAIGSSASPVWFDEQDGTFTLSSVTSGAFGSPITSLTIQSDNSNYGFGQSTSWFTGCTGTCGQPGTYQLGQPAYGPSQGWVIGTTVSDLINIIGGASNIPLIDVEHNYFDMDDIQYPIVFPGFGGLVFDNNTGAAQQNGALTFNYNVVLHGSYKPIVSNQDTIAMNYNYIEGWANSPFSGHIEINYFPGGANNNMTVQTINNTIVATADSSPNSGQAPLWLDNPSIGNGAQSANYALISKYNTIIVNNNQWNGASTESTAMALDGFSIYTGLGFTGPPTISPNLIDPTGILTGAGFCIKFENEGPGYNEPAGADAWTVGNIDLLNGYNVRGYNNCPTSP